MASITIRRLGDRVKEALRLRAARNGRSMEEEARDILESTLTPPKLTSLQLRELREKLAAFRAPDAPSAVDELIAERRAEAARE